jgi:predicted ribosome quality control (RQC) complex YloA/Tae2 family protein
MPVLIDSNNQLGTVNSSRRFEREIKPINSASEAILALKPVTFHYKSDKTGTPQFGLIAEEVAEVNPDLVVRDKNGEIYTVRYDAVNAVLLNEFLKEHRKVEQQEATIAQLKKDFGATIAQLTARLDEQAVQIQKVSAQLAAASPSRGGLEASKPASQLVNNNQ